MIDKGVQHCEEFTLFLNMALGIGGGEGVTRDQQVGIFARGLMRTLKKWNPPDLLAEIKPLPPMPSSEPLDIRHGIFHLYRSWDTVTGELNVVPMITVRVTFDRRNGRLIFDRGGVSLQPARAARRSPVRLITQER